MDRVRPPVRVTIIDDHELLREGLRQMLAGEAAFQVCCSVDSVEKGLECVRAHKPDMCVVDISMPGLSGIDAVKRIREIHPECKVVVLSAHDEAMYAGRAFRAGAQGYVMKQVPAAKIVSALVRVADGEIYMSEAMQQAMLRGFIDSGEKSGATPSGLSPRELEVLRLIGQGLTAAQIGEKLHRSAKTVDVHRQNIKQKLKLATTADLVRFATKWVEGESQ